MTGHPYQDKYYDSSVIPTPAIGQSQQFDMKGDYSSKSAMRSKNELEENNDLHNYSTMGRKDFGDEYPIYNYPQSPNEVEYKSEHDLEIDADIGNVEDIQKELYNMDKR